MNTIDDSDLDEQYEKSYIDAQAEAKLEDDDIFEKGFSAGYTEGCSDTEMEGLGKE